MGFYDYTVPGRRGADVNTKDFEGKVVLVVNTATGCGFTPQYAPIEAMYEKYHDQGFEVLDIPCNQFGAQTPGSDDEVHEFCTLNYNTQFPQMKKSDVNGENALDLYKFLKSEKGFEGFDDNEMGTFMKAHLAKIDPDYEHNSEIKWNFTKFVIDRKGQVVARFEPTADMAKVEECVASLL